VYEVFVWGLCGVGKRNSGSEDKPTSSNMSVAVAASPFYNRGMGSYRLIADSLSKRKGSGDGVLTAHMEKGIPMQRGNAKASSV